MRDKKKRRKPPQTPGKIQAKDTAFAFDDEKPNHEEVLGNSPTFETEEAEEAKAGSQMAWTESLKQDEDAQEAVEPEVLEHKRLELENLEQERLEQQRLEQHRLEQERREQERREQEQREQERLEQERLEQERLEQKRVEQKKLEQEETKVVHPGEQEQRVGRSHCSFGSQPEREIDTAEPTADGPASTAGHTATGKTTPRQERPPAAPSSSNRCRNCGECLLL